MTEALTQRPLWALWSNGFSCVIDEVNVYREKLGEPDKVIEVLELDHRGVPQRWVLATTDLDLWAVWPSAFMCPLGEVKINQADQYKIVAVWRYDETSQPRIWTDWNYPVPTEPVVPTEELIYRMIGHMGDNPNREGVRDTPKRVVKAWDTWFGGYKIDPATLFTTFEDGSTDEMVLLTDIPVFSHCEHHIAPILGVAHIAYLPNKRIVGISKLARVVDCFARRLQVQERLTAQVADCLFEHLNPNGVGVVISARHLCMSTRGVKTPNVNTTTSALRGAFTKPEVRAEFLQLIESTRLKGTT